MEPHDSAAAEDAEPPKLLHEAEVVVVFGEAIKRGAVNTQSQLQRLRFRPLEKSKLHIPMCRLESLQAVRPAMKKDIFELGSHFLKVGYMDGFGAFYVALENDEAVPKTKDVTPEIIALWSPNWQRAHTEFEDFILRDPHLRVFSMKMFHVWDGNPQASELDANNQQYAP